MATNDAVTTKRNGDERHRFSLRGWCGLVALSAKDFRPWNARTGGHAVPVETAGSQYPDLPCREIPIPPIQQRKVDRRIAIARARRRPGLIFPRQNNRM
jgi:hypothetical protein